MDVTTRRWGTLSAALGVALGIGVAKFGIPWVETSYAAPPPSGDRSRMLDPLGTFSDPYLYYPGTEPRFEDFAQHVFVYDQLCG